MPYASQNFKTKKELKARVAALNDSNMGAGFMWYQPGPFGDGEHELQLGDEVTIEGPHYPVAHSWYAQVSRKADGQLKVK